VEDKSVYFVGHCQRTADYAVKLARKELVKPVWQEEIRTAALLRDIGKIGIPEALFLKPGKLTDEEFVTVKSHAVIGENFCSSLAALKPVLALIRHHHERFDGKGYPDGLKGSDIPFGARIIAVADGYDGLTSDRPYRSAFSLAEALAILREGAGTQWDPELVELFCQLVESGTLHFE
jgi:HD-GYP domain-containing protein (c-di-GMP phosphodiesterase class II)